MHEKMNILIKLFSVLIKNESFLKQDCFVHETASFLLERKDFYIQPKNTPYRLFYLGSIYK